MKPYREPSQQDVEGLAKYIEPTVFILRDDPLSATALPGELAAFDQDEVNKLVDQVMQQAHNRLEIIEKMPIEALPYAIQHLIEDGQRYRDDDVMLKAFAQLYLARYAQRRYEAHTRGS